MKFSFQLPDYNARSCKEFYENISYEISRQRKIFKLGCYKRFHNFFLLSHIYGAILTKTLSFWFDFLLILVMWFSNRSFKAKIISSNSFLFSDVMALLSILARAASFLRKVHDFCCSSFSCSWSKILKNKFWKRALFLLLLFFLVG